MRASVYRRAWRSARKELLTATQVFNSWALCLDNRSMIPPWLSDTLCKAVTGDGIVDRALYTDDDVVVLTVRRVLAMTTIDAGALAGDLAEQLFMLDPTHRREQPTHRRGTGQRLPRRTPVGRQ